MAFDCLLDIDTIMYIFDLNKYEQVIQLIDANDTF